MGSAQSTVSQHLKILAEVRFVLITPDGNSRRYGINAACLTRFPTAVDIIMGKPAPIPGGECS